MNPYSKYILPKLINGLMQNDAVTQERKKIIPKARGVVLEIGGGSGTNIPFYEHIEKLIIIEPSEELLALAQKRIASSAFPIEIINSSAEKIDLE